jgi:hypothetical protein
VVGRSLEVLLQGAGYGTRIIKEPTADKPHELLEGIQLVVVAPTPTTESRERFLAGMGSVAAAIPVLTLSMVFNEVPPYQTGSVPWPCRLQDLKTEIEAALLRASRPEASGPSGRRGSDPPDPSENSQPGLEEPQLDGPHRCLGAI